MLDRIFPRMIDNSFRGNRFAIWLFVPVVLMELAIGVSSLINTRAVAASADGFPLDLYTAGGAAAVILLFTIMGLFRVLIALQGVLVLIRYRAMIPFMYVLLLALHFGSKALIALHPVERSTRAQVSSVFAFTLLGMLLVGYVLSLLKKRDASA